jgi:NADPH:quinone reductase-like Zn-dependent oxidoreductase
MSPLVSQRIAMADAVGYAPKSEALMALATLIEDGKVTPVIGRTYSFHEIPAAIAYQEQGRAAGKVVITF